MLTSRTKQKAHTLQTMSYHEEFAQCLADESTKLSLFDKCIGRNIIQKKYETCHYIASVVAGINSMKHNGRYPFIPLFGCTEFFAALFSVFNLIAHLYCFRHYIQPNIKKSPFAKILWTQHVLICCSWIASTIFHTNDVYSTRCLDYLFAHGTLLFCLYYSFARTMFRYKKLYYKALSTVFRVLIVYEFCHMYYMLKINFNYNYSKISCIIIIICHLMLWTLQFFYHRNKPHAKNIIIYQVIVVIGAFIEVYDFPPIYYLVDSHAIWHLITAIAAPFFYKFHAGDMLYLQKKNK